MKRLTPTERAKSIVKSINEFRTVFPGAFTSKQLTLQLQSINCLWAKSIFSILRKSKQIKSIGNKQYVFAFDEPVYYKTIQSILDDTVESFKESQYKWLGKKPKLKETATISETTFESSIEQAITLLKSNGYKISKPVTIYEEI